MSRPVWFVELLKRAFPRRFAVARLTRLPLMRGVMASWLAEGDDLTYLPGDGVVPVNRSVELPNSLVLPSQVVDHFIDQAGFLWVMDFCLCREAEGCQDYPRDLGCLFLGQAVLDINPALGRRVTREEAHGHVRRCREAGLTHLIGRNKLDTLWLGAGPGDRLLTVCNCCPCCCLWRVLPHVSSGIAERVHRMPGVRIRVSDRCTGCGTCTSGVCFVDGLRLVDGKAVCSDVCRGCGRCVTVCPEGAIGLTIDHEGALDGLVSRISNLVDVT
jgi:NAD-dependent dihydropyrimidine dehydrogenase PreA subunit